jgi:hypothetical protein
MCTVRAAAMRLPASSIFLPVKSIHQIAGFAFLLLPMASETSTMSTMKISLHLILACAALLTLGSLATSCTANVTPPAGGVSATTTTTEVNPYVSTTERRTTTTAY